jgi:hypothetical protein
MSSLGSIFLPSIHILQEKKVKFVEYEGPTEFGIEHAIRFQTWVVCKLKMCHDPSEIKPFDR